MANKYTIYLSNRGMGCELNLAYIDKQLSNS